MHGRLMHRLLTRVVAAALLTIIAALNIAAMAAQGTAVKRDGNGSNGKLGGGERIPYIVELGDDSTRNGVIVTLAVGRVTIVRCPEPPLQTLFGDRDGFDLAETVPGRTDIYLRPTKAKLFTNLVVEMKSGSIAIFLRTISVVGGAHVGDYTGEVIIKYSGYVNKLKETENELTQSRTELQQVTDELTQLKEKFTEVEARARNRAITDERELELLKLLESPNGTNGANGRISEDAAKRVRIKQVGKAQRNNNVWLAIYSVDNRTKEQLSLDGIKVTDGRLTTTTPIRRLPARSDSRIAVLIETTSVESAVVTFIINGMPVNMRL